MDIVTQLLHKHSVYSIHHRYQIQYIMSCYTNIVRKLQKMTCRNFATSSSSSSINKRLRRTVHFIPADNTKFLNKSLSLGADTIVLDLEDSVKDKVIARDTLTTFLQSNMCRDRNRDTTEVLVRINPLSTDIWKEDIEVGFLGNVDGFMVPKVESQDELVLLDEILSNLETKQNDSTRKIILPIATETPNAVLNIASIAKSPRVAAITWVSFFVISCVTIICICCAYHLCYNISTNFLL